MSSSSFSISNRLLNSSWNSTFFDPIHVASSLFGLLVISFFLSKSMSSLMLLIASLWSFPMLTWLMTVTSVTMSGLFVRMSSLHRLGFSTSISSLLSSGTWYSRFCTFLMLSIPPKFRLFRFSFRAQTGPLPLSYGLFFFYLSIEVWFL